MTDITDYIRPFRLEPLRLVTAARTGIERWRRRERNRTYLARANARELADMGLSPWQRQHEINKPFWRD